MKKSRWLEIKLDPTDLEEGFYKLITLKKLLKKW